MLGGIRRGEEGEERRGVGFFKKKRGNSYYLPGERWGEGVRARW